MTEVESKAIAITIDEEGHKEKQQVLKATTPPNSGNEKGTQCECESSPLIKEKMPADENASVVEAELNVEPWGDMLRRRALEMDNQLRERVVHNLEALMRKSVMCGDRILNGRTKIFVTQVGIPKTATMTEGCEWKTLVDDWADANKLQATFHPVPSNCPCVYPTASKIHCRCIPKITISW